MLFDNAIINECHGAPVPNATGLSIYFPDVRIGSDFYEYCTEPLYMLTDTHWEEALLAYYQWLELGIGGEEKCTGTTVLTSSNPCFGNTDIICVCRETGDAVLSIMDLAGRQVYSSIFYAVAGESVKLQWNAGTNVSPGMYFLELSSPDGTAASCRVVVMEQQQ